MIELYQSIHHTRYTSIYIGSIANTSPGRARAGNRYAAIPSMHDCNGIPAHRQCVAQAIVREPQTSNNK